MAEPHYYHLMGQIFLAHRAVKANAELFELFTETEFPRRQLEKEQKVHPLVETGAELLDRKIEKFGENRSIEETVHKGANEVEMWWQTAKFRVKKALDDSDPLLELCLPDYHFDDHLTVVVAKSLRIISAIRVESELHENLGSEQNIRDLLQRGWTLLLKLYQNSDLLTQPSTNDDSSAEIFSELRDHRDKMRDWVGNFEQTVRDSEPIRQHLTELGYVPADVGIPLGGTGYSITLHEKAQKEAPDPSEKRPAPGWSAGRQSGRNKENLGKGWA